tara:strand:+ start:93 stop:779 length:687 start_codon:yes stop_codon:yes gene_type:complete
MLILKSLLFSLYYLKISYRNYLPLLIFLLLFHYIVQRINNPLLIFFSFIFYLLASSPVSVNIFRSIISDKPLENYYIQFFYEIYTKLFIKKLFILISTIIGIYIVHLMILSPFIPQDISKMTIFLYILFLYMIYIYTRLFFVLPAASMNKSYSFKDCYFLTKGHSIKIFLYYISLVVPYVILNNFIADLFSDGKSIYVLSIGIFFQILFIVLSTSMVAYLYKETESDS